MCLTSSVICSNIESRKGKQSKHKEDREMKFTIEKVANMVMVVSECEVIFKAWNIEDFTERKLNNTIKRITKDLNGNAIFTRKF